MTKKYYWLKLHKDFFKRHDIRIVEGMENGKDYILFYMKMLLESIDHDGYLRFSETIPYNDKMLATITDTNIDIVRSAIKIFKELKLLDIMDDETIYMNQIQMMIGAETEWAAKKREYRIRLTEDTSRTKKDNVRQEIRDKSIEYKSIDIKPLGQFETFWTAYPKKIGKEKCRRWYETKKVNQALQEKIINAIIKQKDSDQWTRENGRYIPHPYTWLNRGGWEDEIETSRWNMIEEEF